MNIKNDENHIIDFFEIVLILKIYKNKNLQKLQPLKI